MSAGAVVFVVAAAFLLDQSGAGVVTFAEGLPGTAIRIPANASQNFATQFRRHVLASIVISFAQ
jgi:hypothetical protein